MRGLFARTLPCAAILLIASRVAAADDKACVVSGKSVELQEVNVKPAGSTEPFTFDVRDVPIAAHVPARCGDPMTLHIGGALEFFGSRDDVWLTVARDVTTSDGMVTLGRGAQVLDACMQGDRVFVTAIMSSDDVLEGEHKGPDQFISNVEVPCDALTLEQPVASDDDADSESESESEFPDTEKYTYWETRRGNKLKLYRKPQTKAAARAIENPVCEGENCIRYIREISILPGWVHVEVFGGGIGVRGWVPIKQLRRADGVTYGGIFCTGNHGSGFHGFGFGGSGSIREGIVRRDTVVYAEQGAGAWGRFTTATRVKVYVTPKESWASLISVPGLSGGWSGTIPVDTITFDPSPVAPKP